MPQWPHAPDLRPVRAGLDWCNLLFDRAISRDRFRELAAAESLQLVTTQGVLELLRVGKARPDVESLAWSGDGLLVRASSPERYAREPEQHAARCDVQGLWCSTSHDGLTAVEEAKRAVEAALWPEAHHIPCVAGRVDLFADIEVDASQSDGSEWVEREVFRRGAMDKCWSHFATRAREASRRASTVVELLQLREGRALTSEDREALRAQLERAELGQFLGGARVGRSRVLGRDPRLLTYEADRDPSRDKPLVKERWKSAGWDGERRVVRTEVRVSREWFAANDLELEDGSKIRLAGEHGVTWEQLRPLLPIVARALLNRSRETDVRDKRAVVSRRRNSPLWAANLRAHDRWEEQLRSGAALEWEGALAIVARRRVTSLEKETRRAESGLVGAWLHAREVDPTITVAEVALAIGGAVYDGQSLTPTERLDAKARRVAIACGYAPPTESASWTARTREASAAALRAAGMTPDEVNERLIELDSQARRPRELGELGWQKTEATDG